MADGADGEVVLWVLVSEPAARGVERAVRVRLNNTLLPQADTAGGWLVFAVPYDALARGENLLGIGALGRELRVEKVEVRVCCTEVL